jgi:hypothetical protein
MYVRCGLGILASHESSKLMDQGYSKIACACSSGRQGFQIKQLDPALRFNNWDGGGRYYADSTLRSCECCFEIEHPLQAMEVVEENGNGPTEEGIE